jgi:hypothetical protein
MRAGTLSGGSSRCEELVVEIRKENDVILDLYTYKASEELDG